MSSILVFIEHKSGKIKKSSAELLTAAKRSGGTVLAAALGPGSKGLAGETGSYGAQTLFVCEADSLKNNIRRSFPRIHGASCSDGITGDCEACAVASNAASHMATDFRKKIFSS